MKDSAIHHRKRILWLVSWYPNKEDHYTGDFIQRHARAASLLNDIHVLYVTDATFIQQPVFEEYNREGALTEQIVYFKSSKGILNKFKKQQTWFKLQQKSIQKYISQHGLPHAVHVHVAWKAGLIGLWLKYKYGLPYLITEHWGIYNRIVEDNFFKKPFTVRYLIKKIFKKSAHFVSVSQFLAQSVQAWLPKQKITIVPNVVDTRLFFPQHKKNETFTFIHVSSIVPLKNVKGILNAFKICSNHPFFDKIQLIVIGTKDNTYHQYVKEIGLENKVILKGEIAYSQVAVEMQAAHCLILNSFIENSPCVIGEAHCCGLPVIATNVGGIPELVNKTNGVLIAADNDEALSKAILNVFENYSYYDAESIAKMAAQKYAYQAVATELDKVYTSLKNF